jgi:hypothetical protein
MVAVEDSLDEWPARAAGAKELERVVSLGMDRDRNG